MNVQWFVYNEAGYFLGVILAHNRVRARVVAKDEFPDDKIGTVRAAPLTSGDRK